MAHSVTQKLIASHLRQGRMAAGEEIALRIDQTLAQDATGTLVMLEFEAMRHERVQTELSVQYVDHNLLQTDYRNADDHLFLRSACKKFGLRFSPPGNGVSHPVHAAFFSKPGKTLLGSDSHTCSNGSLGMLAIGAGGLEVAMAMAGAPFHVVMPHIWGVRLEGALPPWVSAKDVILEMLRRHGVAGGRGKIVEYYGPGLASLSTMDRHVIANMGAELGATTTVFPSDERTREFLRMQGREEDWVELRADERASYDQHDTIDLSALEPLIALPSSPGNVVPVAEVAGREVYQVYIGTSANPGLRDFAVPALALAGRRIPDRLSLDINPSSRQVLETLTSMGLLEHFILAGARIHQPGCNGCIGMGQAPASGTISLRTAPRNFPGRSGTAGDQVYLCSPETAIAAAITGVITDPRGLDMPCPRFESPQTMASLAHLVATPEKASGGIKLDKGPNIKSLPDFDPLDDHIEATVGIKVGDDISTDDILPAGAKALPYRSNIPEISRFLFSGIDAGFHDRAVAARSRGSIIVGGDNYGQGSSREHAALCPRSVGVRVVLAKSFARIHWQNLANFGVLALVFDNPDDWESIDQGHELSIDSVHEGIRRKRLSVRNAAAHKEYAVSHTLSPRQIDMVLAGGLINLARKGA
jgi:aconitate hydratase